MAAIICFVVVFLLLAPWNSSVIRADPNNTQREEHSETENNKQKEGKSFLEMTTADPIALYTALLTLFTAILATFTIWLAVSTKDLRDFAEQQSSDMKESLRISAEAADAAKDQARAAQVANETSRAILRARIDISESNIERVSLGLSPEVYGKIKNSGQSPAINARVKYSIAIQDYPLKSELTAGDALGPPSTSDIGAGVETQFSMKLNAILDQPRITALQTKTHAIYFFGQVDYSDIFGDPHSKKFVLFYTAIRGFLNDKNPMIIYPEGNAGN
jgi:hypothetical protein